ncbi:carboxymuconolactone decarboxylase family protein [Paraburkholderia bryophila]|uniref:AhpD family alkylhydroperoxidase n=1 Tax=Paraburkholderia bryophila TaxID=420952 RepID=A0A7Y9WQT1_9BURK|nr:carboxymuconolactone decarboxylase family protein [Paraburkholderia bryophila]NYH16266.1 AhpD family alkylhydroperoxidase [Paraburkholderia bryophila]NYH25301.1 AhpD family alkylhydroperoxidase [Paraburkholderia bryophila]
MSTFQVHTLDSAPEQSRPVLQQLQQTFGFIPNIAGAMAESPVLIGAFINLFQKVHSGTFSEAQIQTLLLTNAVTNACSWAVAFHTALALNEGLTPADVEAIRAGRAPADRQHAALSTLAKTAIEKRGHLGDQDVSAFLEAGFRRDQVLELLAVTAASTITNYVGSITQPPLETQFQVHAWHA